MLSLAKTFLKEASKNLEFNENFVNITTTDGFYKSYTLLKKNQDRFLKQCVELLEEKNDLHLNVVLNSMTSHCVLIDVDNGGDTSNTTYEVARNIYIDIVREVSENMYMKNGGDDEDRKSVCGSTWLDAFLFTKYGSSNFHLMFPFLFLDRHDHVWFLERLKTSHPSVDIVQGWMVYGCVKKKNQYSYDVNGCFKCNSPTDIYFLNENDTIANLRGSYPQLKLKNVLTTLFFPGVCPLKQNSLAHLEYGKIALPHNQSFSFLDHCKLWFSYLDTECRIFKVFSILKKLNVDRSEFNVQVWTENLYDWLKAKQNEFDFSNCATPINTYLFKFYPTSNNNEQDEQLMMIDDSELPGAEIMGKIEICRKQLSYKFTVNELKDIVRDYETYYSDVLTQVLDCNNPENVYDIKTIKYELARLHGEPLNIFKKCVIPPKIFKPLYAIVYQKEIENFGNFVVTNILPLIPFAQIDNEIRLFDWNERHWKCRIQISGFFKLLTSALFDYVLNNTKSDDMKKEIRGLRRGFTEEHRNIQIAACYKNYQAQKFDGNPWILGIDGGYTYDILNSVCRLTIPQDYITKIAKLPSIFQCQANNLDESLFQIFFKSDEYFRALGKLRECLENGGTMDAFQYTENKKLDLLFAFIATIFCEDYVEMMFFISYVADCLIGQNFRRWILFLIGDTSNGKTSILRLCQMALGNYSGVLSPEQLYENKNKTAESASPELISKLGCRLLIVEEISDKFPISVANLNSLTGNNRRYVRGLFQSGVEYDVSFKIICTLNTFPRLEITSAIKQRLKVLVLRSDFLADTTTYDFQSRSFPPCPNLQIEFIADTFLMLLLCLLNIQRRDQKINGTKKVHEIFVPKTVMKQLESLEELNTPFAQFTRTYVLANDGALTTVTEVKSHLQNFINQNPLLCTGSNSEEMFLQFKEKYLSYFKEFTAYGPAFDDLQLTSFENAKRLKKM